MASALTSVAEAPPESKSPNSQGVDKGLQTPDCLSVNVEGNDLIEVALKQMEVHTIHDAVSEWFSRKYRMSKVEAKLMSDFEFTKDDNRQWPMDKLFEVFEYWTKTRSNKEVIALLLGSQCKRYYLHAFRQACRGQVEAEKQRSEELVREVRAQKAEVSAQIKRCAAVETQLEEVRRVLKERGFLLLPPKAEMRDGAPLDVEVGGLEQFLNDGLTAAPPPGSKKIYPSLDEMGASGGERQDYTSQTSAASDSFTGNYKQFSVNVGHSTPFHPKQPVSPPVYTEMTTIHRPSESMQIIHAPRPPHASYGPHCPPTLVQVPGAPALHSMPPPTGMMALAPPIPVSEFVQVPSPYVTTPPGVPVVPQLHPVVHFPTPPGAVSQSCQVAPPQAVPGTVSTVAAPPVAQPEVKMSDSTADAATKVAVQAAEAAAKAAVAALKPKTSSSLKEHQRKAIELALATEESESEADEVKVCPLRTIDGPSGRTVIYQPASAKDVEKWSETIQHPRHGGLDTWMKLKDLKWMRDLHPYDGLMILHKHLNERERALLKAKVEIGLGDHGVLLDEAWEEIRKWCRENSKVTVNWSKISSCMQKEDETVDEYTNRFIDVFLVNSGYHDLDSDTIVASTDLPLKSQLLNGMQPEIRKAVRVLKPDWEGNQVDFQQLIDSATRAERDMEVRIRNVNASKKDQPNRGNEAPRRSQPRSQRDGSCHNCGKQGHWSKQCDQPYKPRRRASFGAPQEVVPENKKEMVQKFQELSAEQMEKLLSAVPGN